MLTKCNFFTKKLPIGQPVRCETGTVALLYCPPISSRACRVRPFAHREHSRLRPVAPQIVSNGVSSPTKIIQRFGCVEPCPVKPYPQWPPPHTASTQFSTCANACQPTANALGNPRPVE